MSTHHTHPLLGRFARLCVCPPPPYSEILDPLLSPAKKIVLNECEKDFQKVRISSILNFCGLDK